MRVSRSIKAHVLLLALTLVWGATFVLIKSALAQATPLGFNAVRMVLASAALLAVFGRQAWRHRRPGVWLAGGLAGVCLWVGYELQTTGLALTTPSKSAFLTGVSVVLVPVFLAVGWRRRVNRWTGIGVAAAFVGLYLLTVPAMRGGGLGFGSINRGDLLTLGCAVGFALQIIVVGRATARYPFQQVATIEVLVAAALMLLTMPVMEHPHIAWSATVVVAILVTGLVNTALGFGAQAWAQQFTPPTHTALIFMMEPVFACLTSYLVLGERLGARGGVGAVLILAGVLLSECKSSLPMGQMEQARAAGLGD